MRGWSGMKKPALFYESGFKGSLINGDFQAFAM